MSSKSNKPVADSKDKKDRKTVSDKNKKSKDTKAANSKTNSVASRKKMRDPRMRIASGVFLLLLSLYVLISLIAYFIGYNLTGNIGETIGKYLSEYSFGIGSVYLVLLVALVGSLLAFKGPKIKLITLCKYCFVFLLWMPLMLATVLPQNHVCEPYYGLVGSKLHEILLPYIQEIGIYIILFFFLVIYVIYNFDIKFPSFKAISDRIGFFRKKDNESSDMPQNNDDDASDDEIQEDVQQEEDKDEEDEEDDSSDDETENDISENDVPANKLILYDSEDDLNEDDNDDESGDDDGFEVVVPTKETVTLSTDSDEVSMEITKPVEEKVSDEIGEHFGLDTNFDPKLELSNYKFPPLDLLKDYGESANNIDKDELEANKKRIVDTLANYHIAIDKIKATVGPTVTLYEIIPAAGVKIAKIRGLQDDIALCLMAIGIRIIAPIPGKGTVGIEVPNQKPQIVSMKTILSSERFQKSGYELPFGIGKTISNESYVADLAKMPHILMAGATGQGKSVGINAIISSLLYSKHPAELKFVLVDPKKVELSLYKKIERHFLAKLPDAEEAIITDVRKVVRTLNSLCLEMDNRYELLKDAQVRNIKEYNAKFIARKLNPYEGHRFLPYIVLVVDEFADLIMTAGKEVEAPITRLAQLARAIGIHLIIATQRPSVNIITGTIKANFPARIAFRVISRVDSSTILDTNGADQLIGRGDMLLSTGNDLVRLQCAFIDTPEVEEITDFIGSQRAYPEAYLLPDCPDDKDDSNGKEPSLNPDERDPLFEEAAYIIVQTQQGSTSMLQRKLKLGYNRAGRIIDQLEKAGIVGPFAGSKQREVRVANEMALEQFLKDLNMDNDNEQNYL